MVNLSLAPFCRDCLTVQEAPADAPAARRCAACGSPRLLAHEERDHLALAHIDCDAFYAAVEKRDNPNLRDKPLIIGGGKRGVVSTCCYIARTFGVRSAMPMFKALALCPNAIVVAPDMAKYKEIGEQIRERMRRLTPLVEPLSIDEAFLDLSGSERLHRASPAQTLARLALEIEREIGVSVSIGLSYCKFLAKLASDMDKPRGFAIIGRAEAKALLAPMAVTRIWGVGKVAGEKFLRDGLADIQAIQTQSEAAMIKQYGTEGQRVWRLAQGIDPRKVAPEHETKSISAETTFETDVGDAETLGAVLHGLCEKVSRRLKAQGLAARSVTLKLKTADFKLRTRQRSGLRPTQLAARIFPIAQALMTPELSGAKFRLIGVGAGDLVSDHEADRADLADPDGAKVKATETAMDAIRTKFGTGAIIKGISLSASPADNKKKR